MCESYTECVRVERSAESSKIELFEGEKVFSHKIICIFSGSWAMTLH